jgi:hypothetical protein
MKELLSESSLTLLCVGLCVIIALVNFVLLIRKNNKNDDRDDCGFM